MSIYRNFHAGEAQLQAESGIDTLAYDQDVEQPFQPALNSSEVKFVHARTFSVAASLDANHRPWASPLFGAAGELMTVQDPTTVRLRPQKIAGDPLFDNVEAVGEMGILYLNPSIRRRAKSLGQGNVNADGSITYRMKRMYGLCTKYIFKRSHDMAAATAVPSNQNPETSAQLSGDDRAQLQAADTIFLASHSEEHGTDPTHRGGPPGFVTVVDDATLSIPDYAGNGMFQTLGNLLLDDRVGLLSVDFTTGRTLQITGRGVIRASEPDDQYSQRTLAITIDEIRSSSADIGTWTDIAAFDLQPGLMDPLTPRSA